MKNLIKVTLLMLLFIVGLSCSQEEDNNNNIDSISENESFNKGVDILNIDWEEIPILSNQQARRLGYVNINNELNSQAFLDKSNNTLSVPFDSNSSRKTELGIGLCIKIKVATRNANRNCD